jgi:Uma2 family endonuclease
MLLELRRLEVPPGQRLLLRDVTWQEFETILDELEEHRGSRLAYDRGLLEMMLPLPEHEDVGNSIAARCKSKCFRAIAMNPSLKVPIF